MEKRKYLRLGLQGLELLVYSGIMKIGDKLQELSPEKLQELIPDKLGNYDWIQGDLVEDVGAVGALTTIMLMISRCKVDDEVLSFAIPTIASFFQIQHYFSKGDPMDFMSISCYYLTGLAVYTTKKVIDKYVRI